MKKQSVYELSTTELLVIASSHLLNLQPNQNKKPENDAEVFLSALRITPGKHRVPFSFIYRVYRFWSFKPLNRSALGKALRLKFNAVRGKHETYYLLGNKFFSSYSGDSNRGRASTKRNKAKIKLR